MTLLRLSFFCFAPPISSSPASIQNFAIIIQSTEENTTSIAHLALKFVRSLLSSKFCIFSQCHSAFKYWLLCHSCNLKRYWTQSFSGYEHQQLWKPVSEALEVSEKLVLKYKAQEIWVVEDRKRRLLKHLTIERKNEKRRDAKREDARVQLIHDLSVPISAFAT